MSEADQKFAAAARDWLNTVADEQEAEGRMLAARDAAEAYRRNRMELEKVLGECIGAGSRARAASCGRYTVLVERDHPMGSACVRKIPTIKAGVDAP